jgi:hypothetical protein
MLAVAAVLVVGAQSQVSTFLCDFNTPSPGNRMCGMTETNNWRFGIGTSGYSGGTGPRYGQVCGASRDPPSPPPIWLRFRFLLP